MAHFSARLLSFSSLSEAEQELFSISVDHSGIARMSGKMFTRCIHLPGLQCRQANILKQEMLSLGGDVAVARGAVACAIDNTDVILIGTEKQLRRLCGKLSAQPFGLPSLAGELERLLATTNNAPKIWRTSCRGFSLEHPLIMGILNITPDSFSDAGRHFDPLKAMDHALEMQEQGADIIDIGGESTRPGARTVPEEEECRRVLPVIEKLADTVKCAISIDTWKSSVAQHALASGAEIINDISGFNFDPEMPRIAADSNAGVVLMHTRSTPDIMQKNTKYDNLMGEIAASLGSSASRALEAGVAADRIAIDPGIGFGKNTAGNLEILRRLSELKSLGFPLLVGPSRKSFIGEVTGRKQTYERIFGTAAAVALAVANGASIIRVHDVAAMRDTAMLSRAIQTGMVSSDEPH